MIHIEQQWQENVRTIEGRHLHEKAHDYAAKEKRGDLIIARGMPIFSNSMGISGICDVVELHKNAGGVSIFGQDGNFLPIPVEYKRGKPKEDDVDILQLTAQAMCLEEMLICNIESGYLFYGETKHRIKVKFLEEHRERVMSICGEMHKLYDRRHTPKVKISKACKACSLSELCIPKLCAHLSVAEYIEKNLNG